MSWPYGRQTPDQNLMRFIARRFHGPARFMDIGSGEGSNARELRERRHRVFSIDKDPKTDALAHADIRDFDLGDRELFDCIYDVNTLCHVNPPPFEKIKSWIKPEGYFFTIWPTHYAPKRIEEGKDFTQRASEYELRGWLTPIFSNVKIYWHSYPDFLDNQIDSHIAEARP